MEEVYGIQGRVVEISDLSPKKALFEFSPSSERGLQRMWVDAADVWPSLIDAGIQPKPLPPLEYTGGGIIACHPCGNAYEECECPSP